jgi:hypothetical protein
LAPFVDQGRNVVEHRAALPSRDARVIASAREWKALCWIYGWTRRLTVPAGACTHACIAARLVIPWKLRAPHAVLLGCTICVDEFRSGLWPKAEPAPIGLVYSILSPEWNADKTRVDKVRYWTAVARLFRGIDLCRSESMEEVDL